MTEAFTGRVVAALIAAGVVLAAAFALLTAYAPELRGGRDGGAHALSVAGTGYSGIVALAQTTGTAVRTTRDPDGGLGAGLLVLTPGVGADPEQVAELVEARVARRGAAPVLIVLPKWQTTRMENRPAWVQTAGLISPRDASAPMARLGQPIGVQIRERGEALRSKDANDDLLRGADWTPVPPPVALRSIDAAGLQTILANGYGDVVLAWLPARDLYVLADPDLLANHRLRDPAVARGALELLRYLGGDRPGGIVFDLTLNGFAAPRSLLRLAFEPPFLTFTLALLAVAALAGAHAAVRFGTPRPTPRAIPFGKRALVENAAELIRAARREPALAVRYAALMRDAAAAETRAPPGLDASAVALWLDKRRDGDAFATLADRAATAPRRDAALAAAQALYRWKQEVTHDRR